MCWCIVLHFMSQFKCCFYSYREKTHIILIRGTTRRMLNKIYFVSAAFSWICSLTCMCSLCFLEKTCCWHLRCASASGEAACWQPCNSSVLSSTEANSCFHGLSLDEGILASFIGFYWNYLIVLWIELQYMYYFYLFIYLFCQYLSTKLKRCLELPICNHLSFGFQQALHSCCYINLNNVLAQTCSF